MKVKKLVVAMFAAGVVVSPLVYATNGDEMMAVGSQSTALGGTGVANFIGAESTWANPAMLGKSKGSEITGGVVSFTPTVTNNGMGGVDSSSKANTSYIPDVSYSSRINDSLSYGVAVAGIAGMGVDYSSANSATHIKAKSALSILRVVPTLAYNSKDFGVGLSPIFQSGSLMLSYNNGGAVNAGESSDSSSGYGYSLGGYYNLSALTLAASYQSEIAAKYGKQISAAGTGFGQTFGDDLNQPAEMKAGVAYVVVDSLTLTADYKLIQWGSAAGYKDFNWKDQTIVAVGAKYAADSYWLGLGYNNANNPIGTADGTTSKGAAINLFNNMFFPAVVTNSYTFGGGYNISKSFAVEGAAVITPKETVSVPASAFGVASNTTTHSQQSYSVSLRYAF
jgi:long-chain fatty acid transport protein